VKKIYLKLCIIILTTFVVGCSNDPTNEIVGRWYDVDDGGKSVMELFEDGSVQMSGEMEMSGSYTFPDDNHIRLDMEGIGALMGPMIFEYSLASGELIFKDTKGKVYVHVPTAVEAKVRLAERKKSDLEAETAQLPKGLIEKVNEALDLVTPVVAAVDKFYQSNGRLPYMGDSNWVRTVDEISDSRVSIGGIGTTNVRVMFNKSELGLNLPDLKRGFYIRFEPTETENGRLSWSCVSDLQYKYAAALQGNCVRILR